MFRLQSAIVLLILCVPLSSAAAGDRLAIAKGGKPALGIFTGGGGTAKEAAEDLRYYLKRITGTEFTVRPETDYKSGPAIVVGGGALAEKGGISRAAIPDEGYVIRRRGDHLFLVGADRTASDRGTWYAVTDLLERELGVRWLWPGELGIVLPRDANLSVGQVDRSGAPAMHIRNIRNAINNRNPNKLLRGMKMLSMDPVRHERMIQQAGEWSSHMKLGQNVKTNYGHAFGRWWKEYGAQHPEFFAMMPDGKRIPVHADRVKLCVSNAAVAEQWMKNARQFFKQEPDSISVSASPNDNAFQGHCLCPECEKWDAPGAPKVTMDWLADGKTVSRPHVLLGDRYIRFANRVAGLLEKEYPGKMVGFYAYGAWKNPPLLPITVSKNIILGYVGNPDIYVRDLSGKEDLREWETWSKTVSNLFYRPNILHAGSAMPLVYVHKLAADLKFRADHGMIGCDFDSLIHHWSTNGLNYYVLAKLLWDPHADVDGIVEDYVKAAFGPAASLMKAYYRSVEDRTDFIARNFRKEPEDNRKLTGFLPEYYPPQVIASWRKQMQEASQSVPSGSIYEHRIRWMAQGLDYADLTSRVIAAGQANNQGALAQIGAERDRWYQQHLYDFVVFPPLLRYQETAAMFGQGIEK